MPPFSPFGWQLFFWQLSNRIGMAMPGMVLIPIIINNLNRRGFFRKYPKLSAPLQVNHQKLFFFGCHHIIIDIKTLMIKLGWISQVSLCGLILTFTTPLCCAIFEQKTQISVSRLEEDLKNGVKSKSNCDTLYYNKGL